MRRRHPELEPSNWRNAGALPRVLVEHHDVSIGVAVGNLLEAEGYEVSNCSGPDGHRRSCPLSLGGECDRSHDADVVFFGLNISDEDDRAVLLAWREHYRDIPVIVEMPVSRIPLYKEELEGCLAVPQPITRETLLDAVERALRSRTAG